MSRAKKVLIIIFVLASCLRLYKLGQNPPNLYWDEVSLGYNAYSILKTGRDEHGQFLPIDRFVAFGDYKPPGYIYMTVPFIWLFGLNEFSVRLPSALAGIGTVILTYFLTREIVKNFFKKKPSTNELIALISSFLLAISPWHLQMSRVAFEANLALFFNTAALLFFFVAIKKKPKFLVLSSLFFMLAFYTFNANRIVSILLVLGLALFFRKEIWQKRKAAAVAGLLAVVLALPSARFLASTEGKLRFKEVSIFNNLEPLITSNQQIEWLGNSKLARLFFNRRIAYGWHFLKHYFDHFEPKYLFISGDRNPRFSTQDAGLFYLFELPLLLMGFYYLLRKKDQNLKFLLFWLAVALIPSSLAKETPHALRTLSQIPAPQIMAAIGVWGIYKKSQTKYRKFLHFAFCILIFSNVVYYFHSYWVHWPVESFREWQHGYKPAVLAVKEREAAFGRVVISKALKRPYVYFLFYNIYPPKDYWQNRQAERDGFGFWHIESFDKYVFGLDKLEDIKEDEDRVLVLAGAKEKPSPCKILEEIKYPNDEPYLVLCSIKHEE